MDKQFLEFWGNVFLWAAKGQRQMDELATWLAQGMRGLGDLTAMFQQCYGLGAIRPGEESGWQAARNSFDTAFRAYLDMLGCVPKSEYAALQAQLQGLKQKTEQQEAALRQLRQELAASRMAQGDVVSGFQELIQVQSEQFQELADRFSRLMTGR